MSSAQEQYLTKVLPWPHDGAGGFINIHWTFEPSDHKPGKPYPWSGRACRSIAEALSQINYNSSRHGTRDIYVCQSQQTTATEKVGKNNYHYFKAERSSANASYLKSLFIDIDLKDYESDAALRAASEGFFAKFLRPSVVVSTGGGYHIYWTFSQAITLAEWEPLAHSLVEAILQSGLKCDTQCTIDSARVLRIPDTANFKRGKRVELVHLTLTDYDVEEIRKALLPYPVTARVLHKNGADPNPLFPQRQPVPNELAEGLEASPKPRLQEIADVCGFIQHTVNTRGADNLNPLWFQTLNLATFVEEGRDAAHAMSDGYKTYTKEETDRDYDRAVRTHAERPELGWPLCDSFKVQGSKQCDSCPHLQYHKSPFHALQQAPPALAPSLPSGVKVVNVLPAGYGRNEKELITKRVESKSGDTEHVLVCETPIRNGWVQRNPWTLHFEADTEPGKPDQLHLLHEVIGAENELRKELAKQGVTLQDYQLKLMKGFLLSWTEILKQTKDAVISTSPFGWNVANGKMEGFSYGGKLYTPNEVKIAQMPDTITARNYMPTGESQPWIDAAKFITDQKRPALDAILASSFAAPLVRFTNQPGLMMSCIGESGIGKSTGLDVALAVWGHPKDAKNTLQDTENYVMNKVGELQALPIYWDDLQPDDTGKYARMVFQMSYGREKNRLGANAKPKESGTWQTIMISTSNNSLLDYVTKQGYQTTSAGVYRIFEIQVASGKGGPGQIERVDAGIIVGMLHDNHGRIGEQYAKYLGENFQALKKEVEDYQRALDKEINAQNEERNWTSVMACICVGASVANRIGFTNIDEASLRAFLLKTLQDMRETLKDYGVDLSKELDVASTFNSFCNAYRARNMLFTNVVTKGPGKPLMGSIRIEGNPVRLEVALIQIGREDGIIRIDRKTLLDWLRIQQIPQKTFIDALKNKFNMKQIDGGYLGAGTEYKTGKAYILEMSMSYFEDKFNPNDLFEKTQAEVTGTGKKADG